jgi:hypothetical protein
VNLHFKITLSHSSLDVFTTSVQFPSEATNGTSLAFYNEGEYKRFQFYKDFYNTSCSTKPGTTDEECCLLG